MRANPRCEDYPANSPVPAKMVEFNTANSGLLRGLQCALSGDPTLLSELVDVMFELKQLAEGLFQLPSGDGDTTAGPSFEYVPRPQIVQIMKMSRLRKWLENFTKLR